MYMVLIWQIFSLMFQFGETLLHTLKSQMSQMLVSFQKLSMNPVIVGHIKPHLIHFKKFEKDQVQVAFCLMSDLGSVVSQSSQMVYLITFQHQMR